MHQLLQTLSGLVLEAYDMFLHAGAYTTGSYFMEGVLDYDGTYPITVEAYAKPVIGKGNGAVISTRGCWLDTSDSGRWQLAIQTESGAYVMGNEELEQGRRDHVAGIFDGKTLKVWVNGRKNLLARTTMLGRNDESHKLAPNEAVSGGVLYHKWFGFLIGGVSNH